MSQVFAAINHRLSEEYINIEVQSQEAKDRYVNYLKRLASVCDHGFPVSTQDVSRCPVFTPEAFGAQERERTHEHAGDTGG